MMLPNGFYNHLKDIYFKKINNTVDIHNYALKFYIKYLKKIY
jgi:hypothetical protein